MISSSISSLGMVLGRTLGIPVELVTPDLSYQSIGAWNSLNHVRLMTALEEAYGVKIDADLVVELTSVARIGAFLEQSRAGQRHAVSETAAGEQRDTSAYQATGCTTIQRGLQGVYLDQTSISHVDGQGGNLFYRGYSIHDLVVRSTFEEVSYLLVYGRLPTRSELTDFETWLRAARTIPEPVLQLLRGMRNAHPMDALRTSMSFLAGCSSDREDTALTGTTRNGIDLIAKVATVVAAHHALRSGREPVAPHASLSHAANFLYMLRGDIPSERATALMDKDLILHAEHGTNASTFAARVATGTGADIYAAVTAAIATFSGPLHGGAVENVMKMVQEIGEPGRAGDYVRRQWERREPVMGFGHRVYRVEDPRARHLRDAARTLSAEAGEPRWLSILEAVSHEMQDYGRHGLHANVDFYAGVSYHLMGLTADLFVPIFVVSRISGWIAHILEQLENNVLIRPLLHYVGDVDRTYLPIDSRSPNQEP